MSNNEVIGHNWTFMVLIGYNNGYPMKVAALVITPELLRLIADLEEFKGSWRSLTTLAPEKLATLKRVATIESIGSSTRIEGAKLSDEEVESLLNKLDRTSFVSRDEQEVAGYSEIMTAIFDSYQEIFFLMFQKILSLRSLHQIFLLLLFCNMVL